MSFRTLQAYSLTALCMLVGILASIETGDWTWFSRSGAAVVAIGIVLTSHQIFEHNRHLREYDKRPRKSAESHGNYSHDWADENSIRELIRSRSREEDRWRREFNGFYMLVTGTLVWGFGDLIERLFR